ncbi:hypothetical protein CUC08_Gglean010238 [Alternaria sp. MG1]|jgi:hypothetical protein|uniref:Uncharacterized protein n=3 Tax=Alternaria alternata complex TaxID=187734 RepID=A0A4V1WRW7_ALTAL|nr:uncharacterized protein J4E82_008447 [Alternaria postmessia]OWY43146.1 hypothetical protein AALT_g662 [Alternaria alternata]RII05145.1 hypothetical protein CUC08_Gglean010238 [Alternaria sp. MG1]RYN35120.1 hypothetical protein AA0115_g2243 [Alternaria tenuissima]KAI5372851.1 hypothetical protein J4E82_008447 [Alternaria postmessia]RYN60938.1 hypothetical protein AA0114_g937 [Alternaria tenuissima]
MAIKAGDLVATVPGSSPTMISDGKRMRVLWVNGHGDGDSTKSFIDRSKTTVRGHPTWKLFAGDVPSPIFRGRREPPKYVYLDDRACYAIYSSKFYDEKELKTFWPYDFDNLGNIKASRPNRGRPAYLDTACTTYAKGPLRGGKTEGYEFCGAASSCGEQTSQRRVKKEAERAHAKEVEDSAKISLSGAIPVTPSPSTNERVIDPRGYPIGSKVGTYSARPVRKQEDSIGNGRIKFERRTPPKHYEPGPVNGDVKPLGIPNKAIQGSPYLNIPAASVRKRPRHMSGDMAGINARFNSKDNAEERDTEVTTKQKRIKVKQEEGDLVESMV